jgi:HEAT repeat protein
VPALLEVLNDLPAAARLRVARALASVKDTRTIPALMKLMENGSMLSAYWAERGLENLRQDLIYFFPGR